MDMTSVLRRERREEPPPPAADGTPRLRHVAYDDDGYPHSDGAPLAQNTLQGDQVHYAFSALRTYLRERVPGAFVANDLLIYPRPRDLGASMAPDVFVAFGAGDEPRLSYRLWEGEPVPAFVLEVLSDSTADRDLGAKRDRYAEMGVREFWVFDPFAKRIPGRVAGHRLRDGRYRPIAPLPGTGTHPSAVLGLEFRAEGGDLRIRDPAAGEDLQGHGELRADKLAAQRRADAEARRADAEAKRADAEATRADAEAERADAEAERAEAEAERAAAFAAENARLRRLLGER